MTSGPHRFHEACLEPVKGRIFANGVMGRSFKILTNYSIDRRLHPSKMRFGKERDALDEIVMVELENA